VALFSNCPTVEQLDVAHVREGLHASQLLRELRITLDALAAGLEQPDGPLRTSAGHHSPSGPSPYCIAKLNDAHSLAAGTTRKSRNRKTPAGRPRPHLWRLESHYDFHGLKTVQVLDFSHTTIFDEDLEELVPLGSVHTLNLSGCMCSLNAEPLSRIHHIHTRSMSYCTMLSRVEGLNVHLTLAAMSGRRKPSRFCRRFLTAVFAFSRGTAVVPGNNDHFWRASDNSDARDPAVRLRNLRFSARAAFRLRPEKLPGRKRGFRRMPVQHLY
jgi:hypothetical protein